MEEYLNYVYVMQSKVAAKRALEADLDGSEHVEDWLAAEEGGSTGWGKKIMKNKSRGHV